MVEKRHDQQVIEISYMQYDKLMRELVGKVNDKLRSMKCTGFYGLKRGGYPIAVHLSHHCGLPLLDYPEKNCIIVDDIADSGKTLLEFKQKKYFIVTLFCKDKSIVKPNIYIKVFPEEDWIIYPWEMKE